VVNSFWKFGVGKEVYEVVVAELVDIQKEQQLSHLAQSYTFTLVVQVHITLVDLQVVLMVVEILPAAVNNKVAVVALHI
jgi:cytochrome b